MVDREATPDILGAVISGGIEREEGQKNSMPSHHKDSMPVNQHTSTPASPKTVNPGGQKSESLPGEQRDKATFYLSSNTLMELEEKWVKIRRISGSKKVSKSLIVEEALRMAFNDFDRKKESGELYFSLLAGKTAEKA